MGLLTSLPRGRWFNVFAVAVGWCLVVLVIHGFTSEFHPGNLWGLGYGIAATVLMLAAAAYAVRRRMPRWGPWRSRDWLQFHIYGGILFVFLLLMHTGFRFPAGVLGWSLWVLSVWLVVSGLLGIALQKWIPRILTSGLSTEVLYERIPELVAVIRGRAEKLVKSCDQSVQDIYRRSMAALLDGPRLRLIYYIDITGGIQSRTRQFDHLRGLLSAEDSDKLTELTALLKTKLELDAHYTLQKSLRWWLYGHVPVSILLIVLVGLHIFSIAYY